jgi:hypothetical protein
MALIAHQFHSIEADGPWTSPPFPPAERRHIVQGVVGGFLSGRPRWATDLDGTFLYGLDAKGKEMKSAPSATRRHSTVKKSGRQMDREIAHALRPKKDVKRVAEDALDAFWATVAASYPEAKHGDMTPAGEVTLKRAAIAAITEWVEYNAS